MSELVVKLTKDINCYNSKDSSRRSGVLSTDQLYYVKEEDYNDDENDKVRIYLTPNTEDDEDNSEFYVKLSDIKDHVVEFQDTENDSDNITNNEDTESGVDKVCKNIIYRGRLDSSVRYDVNGKKLPAYYKYVKLYCKDVQDDKCADNYTIISNRLSFSHCYKVYRNQII